LSKSENLELSTLVLLWAPMVSCLQDKASV